MLCAPAAAQTYPEKTVVMIAPFPAGGSVDLVARAIAQHMSDARPRSIGYTAFECERDMRRMTNGERGCANPDEHRS